MGMMRWKRLFSSMEVLVAPTIQKAFELKENPPTPKKHHETTCHFLTMKSN